MISAKRSGSVFWFLHFFFSSAAAIPISLCVPGKDTITGSDTMITIAAEIINPRRICHLSTNRFMSIIPRQMVPGSAMNHWIAILLLLSVTLRHPTLGL
jgi:hypothetical protein